MRTSDGFDHRWGRNGESCVVVHPVTMIANILAYCMPAYLGLTLAGSMVKGDELPRDGPHGLCVNLLRLETADWL